jgi:ribose/xylose/arabinose/galactoside ABC-type transport system permease subunit
MCFVIMTGGIDLSVGSTAAMSSVIAAYISPHGLLPGLAAGATAGATVGIVNGILITRLNILPFIATLAGMLAASGTGLLVAGNQSIGVSYESGFTEVGQGDFLGFPVPAWIAIAAYVLGSLALNFSSFGRNVLAVGGGEDAARLMVVGGTLLTGGVGSVGATLSGVLLLGLVFNILNFENGMGLVSLRAHWQSIIRGAFLLLVIIVQSRLALRVRRRGPVGSA